MESCGNSWSSELLNGSWCRETLIIPVSHTKTADRQTLHGHGMGGSALRGATLQTDAIPLVQVRAHTWSG